MTRIMSCPGVRMTASDATMNSSHEASINVSSRPLFRAALRARP
jgi:hypothetical protein